MVPYKARFQLLSFAVCYCVLFIFVVFFSVSDNDMNLVVYRYKPEGKLRAWNVLLCLAFRDQQMVLTAQLQGALVPALENIGMILTPVF